MVASAVTVDATKLREINDRIATFGGLTVRVGIVGPGALALEEGSSLTLAQLGLMFEFGTVDMPERSWFRATLAARRADIAALHVNALKAVIAGKMTPRAAHDAIGMQVAAWLKAGIAAGISPPNAPSTIAAKKSSKPLVDHGQFINSITWIVEEKAA